MCLGEQLWLSYLRAVIEGKYLKKTKRVLKQAKKKGLKSKELNALQKVISTGNAEPLKTQRNELLAHYQNGRTAEAENLAAFLIEQFPKHQLAWKVLGAILGKINKKSDYKYRRYLC